MTDSTNSTPRCLVCERPHTEVPLLMLRYQDSDAWICPQHLPILIHRPQELVDLLPGAANLGEGAPHDHH